MRDTFWIFSVAFMCFGVLLLAIGTPEGKEIGLLFCLVGIYLRPEAPDA